MKTFVEEFIENTETEDLDIEFPYYESNNQDGPNEVLKTNKVQASNNCSLDIDRVIAGLKDFKAKGANRVYIDYNADHASYIFSAVKLVEI